MNGRLGMAMLTTWSLVAAPGCAAPECVSADYAEAECRVIAENEFARLRTSTGIEIRFQDPAVTDASTWDATGLLEELEPGVVRARVAGAGDFALSLVRDPVGSDAVQIVLQNVDPAAMITVGPDGAPMAVDPPDAPGAIRIDVDLPDTNAVWIRGRRDCPGRYRVALTSDVQTNPGQFQRIADRLGLEAVEAAAAGEPLVAVVMPGDLTEESRDDEFETIAEILTRIPVPVAVTTGNHDVYRSRRPHYNRNFGPGNHAFSVCDTRFVMLDTGSGSLASSIQGRLPELLDNRGQRFLVAGMHHPPFAALSGSGWSREDQAQIALAELALAGTDLIVAGHNHSLRDWDVHVGDTKLRELVVGTAGAFQGLGEPRYGYVRLRFGPTIDTCFVEVPPPGYSEPPNGGISDRLPACPD